jgi:hypothetical protein
MTTRRRFIAGAATVVGLALAVAAAWLAGVFASGGSDALVIRPAVVAPFPVPPVGAVVLAAQDGVNALGLGVLRRNGKTVVQASVVSAQDTVGVSGLAVRFRIRSDRRLAVVRGSACGAGCYHASVSSGWPTSIAVVIAGHRPASTSFVLPPGTDIKPGAQIVARAERTWVNLRTLVDHDALSGGHVTLHTIWHFVAPDKVAYVIKGGGSSIVIGDRSWQKAAGGSVWTEQAQSLLRQPVPFWSKAIDAHILGTVSLAGRPAWKVSFFDPSTPAWYTIVVDKATFHTTSLAMITTSHFMHDEYSGFDVPLSIKPPTRVAGQS